MKYKYFTDKDIYNIRKYYGKQTVEFIQKYVNHSRGSIEWKARKLGLSSSLRFTASCGRPCSEKLKKKLSIINSGKNSVLYGNPLPKWRKIQNSIYSKKMWKNRRSFFIKVISKATKSKKHRLKMRFLCGGKKNGMYGKHHSKLSREKISNANILAHNRKNSISKSLKYKKQRSIIGKRLWKNPTYAKKVRKAISLSLKNLLPTFPEYILCKIMEITNLPFDYTGNRTFYVGRFNPDFVCKKYKKIIEIYGEYHHNFPENKKRDAFRKIEYAKYGYGLLILPSKKVIKEPHETLLKVINFYLDES